MKAYLLSLNPAAAIEEQWDFGLLEDFLKGDLWQPSNWQPFDIQKVDSIPTGDKAIVVLPARHHEGMEDAVKHHLNRLSHVVLFLMGDEEAVFDIEKIKHPSIHIWVQNPHPGKHDAYNKLGTGYPPQSQAIYPNFQPHKALDLYFSGQITHPRRREMYNTLLWYEAEMNKNIVINRTSGFTQGVSHESYYRYITESKIVPCPCGAVIPDSFRLFEALEGMAIPIADEQNSSGSINQYWDWLFGEIVPFPKVTDWDRLPGLIEEILTDYPNNLHRQTAWWIRWKRNFAYKVMEQLHG